MPPSLQQDPWDRRVLIVSDKGDGANFEPVLKELGTPVDSDDFVMPAGVKDTNGNWATLVVDATGRLQVVVTGAGSGGTSLTDDSVFTPGADGVTPAGAFVDDDATNVVAEGNAGSVRMSPTRILLVREGWLDNPQIAFDTASAVAAGALTNIDSVPINVGKTAYLTGVLVTSSVPFKAVLRTVSNGVESDPKAVGIPADRVWDFRSPGRNIISVAEDPGVGFDGFRLEVTNLDTSAVADIYATFYYDEV